VFSALFGEPERSLEVFNAFSPVQFPPDTPVTMETLDDVLFMDRVNDLAFLVGNILIVLIEHQSSLNENLPLRLLLYIGRVYEKIVNSEMLYRHALVTIPSPQFIVLYNGERELPNGEDRITLKLSDAFEKLPELREKIQLELEVPVYNINAGHNEAILARSETLRGYSAFIAAVRKYLAQGQDLEDAIRSAVTECVSADILAEFLKRHSSEVLNMLTQEWNWDKYYDIRYEEGIQQGIQRGAEQRAYESARRMFARNVPLEQIAEFTLLPLDRLRVLQQEKNNPKTSKRP
jgi:predicted transposase/invertase (TIGR01784 family)